jgi:hypothetical protein
MKWFYFFIYNPYFNPHSDWTFFNTPIKSIEKPERNEILNKWNSIYYDNKHTYVAEFYQQYNETFLWTNCYNKTSTAYYMIIGDFNNEVFDIKYVIEKPYAYNCDFIQMKKDLQEYINQSNHVQTYKY